MPFPLLMLIPVAAAAAGGIASVKGAAQMAEAEDRYKNAQNQWNAFSSKYRKFIDALNQELKSYDSYRQKIMDSYFPQLVEYLASMKIQTDVSALSTIQSLRIKNPQLCDFCLELDKLVFSVVKNGFQGYVAGQALSAIAVKATATFACASTGTPIAALSGAAATKATMAALGGGAVSAGGAGMAGGAMVLGGLVVAPVVLLAGLTILSESEDALTAAADYESSVRTEIAKRKRDMKKKENIRYRIKELRKAIDSLADSANTQLQKMKTQGLCPGMPGFEDQLKILIELSYGLKELLEINPVTG